MEYPNDEILITFTSHEIEVLCSALKGLAYGKSARVTSDAGSRLAPIMEKLRHQQASQESRVSKGGMLPMKGNKSLPFRIIHLFQWTGCRIARLFKVFSKANHSRDHWERVRKEENFGKHPDFTFIITRDDLLDIL